MKLNYLICLSIMLSFFQAAAQHNVSPTDSFVIRGKIANEFVITLADLDTFPKVMIKDQIIYNQNGEPKDTITNMKGVLLQTILAPLEYLYDKPQTLNDFGFVFTGSNSHPMRLSWNDIYNPIAGNQFYFVTEMGGIKLKDMSERILFISTADLKKNRMSIKMYIRKLQMIEVKQLE